MHGTTPFGSIHRFLYRLRRPFDLVPYLGTGKRCPVCKHNSTRFAPLRNRKRKNARCVWCGSLERHRLIWLFFQRKTDLGDGRQKTMLHFAPEPAFIDPLSKSIGHGYVTADLDADAMVRVDITNVAFPKDSFDIVYCCHVLEHIVDDVKAIRELSRVLKNDGWALIVVPISRERTYEDKTILDAAGRLAAFGQRDHARRCGLDYVERLANNGFIVEQYSRNDVATKSEQELFGLIDETLYYCRKHVAACA